jgi:hypothetical protein
MAEHRVGRPPSSPLGSIQDRARHGDQAGERLDHRAKAKVIRTTLQTAKFDA